MERTRMSSTRRKKKSMDVREDKGRKLERKLTYGTARRSADEGEEKGVWFLQYNTARESENTCTHMYIYMHTHKLR